MANYDFNLPYHCGKVNAVPDSLSRKSMTMFLTQQKKLIKKMNRLDIQVIIPNERTTDGITSATTFNWMIKEAQKDDLKLQKFQSEVEAGQTTDMNIDTDRSVRFGNSFCISNGEIRQ